jgi:DNA-binding LacI/PurR family transcriptional regulator
MDRWGLEPASLGGGITEQSGANAADLLLASTSEVGPTAVAAFNDRCALGFMYTLIRRGIHVPEDVSVAGFDDIAAAAFAHVNLTTVRQDTDRLGELAVHCLRHRLEDGTAQPPTGVVPATLMIRETTAPPRA